MKRRRRLPRPSLVMLPNGFTLANLFFGIFAIVAASRGQHAQAGWYIVIGAFADDLLAAQMRDGRWRNDVGPGDAFATAVACILLQMPKQYLPIFQR